MERAKELMERTGISQLEKKGRSPGFPAASFSEREYAAPLYEPSRKSFSGMNPPGP